MINLENQKYDRTTMDRLDMAISKLKQNNKNRDIYTNYNEFLELEKIEEIDKEIRVFDKNSISNELLNSLVN